MLQYFYQIIMEFQQKGREKRARQGEIRKESGTKLRPTISNRHLIVRTGSQLHIIDNNRTSRT